VTEALAGYGAKTAHREVDHVRLGILKLAEGSAERVREYAAVALSDYRDVLAWAEYPEYMRTEARNRPERERSAARARD
jgi:hypothetical protein